MLTLLFSLYSYAEPLSCDEILKAQETSKVHEIHRQIQKEGIEENVPACLKKKSLENLIPDSQADLIAPEDFHVQMTTTKGAFLVHLKRDWSPLGVDRFYTLVTKGFFSDMPFFRAIRGFMIQFGIHNAQPVRTSWQDKALQDDPSQKSNLRGTLSFATAGPNTRTTQIFINTNNNTSLDAMGFTPIGEVVHTPQNAGLDIVDRIFTGYGEGHPTGRGPSQELMQTMGTDFLKEHYPYLDYIKSIHVCQQPNPIQTADCQK